MITSARAMVVICAILAWSQTGYVFYETRSGTPLRWYRGEVPVRIDKALCADMNDVDTLAAIRRSIATWNEVPCREPPLVDKGLASGLKPIIKSGNSESGNNLVIFPNTEAAWRDGKAGVNVDGVLALTTLFYDPATGEARSYALEVNDWQYTFDTIAAPVRSGVDLENTLTHELGHVMGLDHSLDTQSTMYFSAPPGETKKRTLEDDDRDGLCSLYSEIYAEVNPDADVGGGGKGCSSDASDRSASAAALLPLLLAMLMLAASRRRSRLGTIHSRIRTGRR